MQDPRLWLPAEWCAAARAAPWGPHTTLQPSPGRSSVGTLGFAGAPGCSSAPSGTARPQVRTGVLVGEKKFSEPGSETEMGRAVRWGPGAGRDVLVQKGPRFAIFALSLPYLM